MGYEENTKRSTWCKDSMWLSRVTDVNCQPVVRSVPVSDGTTSCSEGVVVGTLSVSRLSPIATGADQRCKGPHPVHKA